MSSSKLKEKNGWSAGESSRAQCMHVASQRSYGIKFRRLEEDVAQAQEDATDRAIK